MDLIRSQLPPTWTARVEQDPRTEQISAVLRSGPSLDALVVIVPPHGRALRLGVGLKATSRGPGPALLVDELLDNAAAADSSPALFAEYVSPSLRRRLEERNISGVDTTGWMRIVSDDPAILVRQPGADRAPHVRDETIERFSGPSTSRVLRGLVSASVPLGVRQLAADCGVSPGTVAKILPTLEREGIVTRTPRGQISSIRRADLITRWAQDYRFTTGNRRLVPLLDPRGHGHARELLSARDDVLLSGVDAASAVLPEGTTPVVPAKRVMAYAADPLSVADELGFRPSELARANVLLAVPADFALMQEGWSAPHAAGRIAPIAQVLVDLESSPGREADLAEQLISLLPADDQPWSVEGALAPRRSA